MATILKNRDRNVIPRWRDFRSTVSLGELQHPAEVRKTPRLVPDLKELYQDWRDNQSLAFAGDLLSAASMTADKYLAREAAEYVLSMEASLGKQHPLITLAHSALSSYSSITTTDMPLRFASTASDEIAALRLRLASSPRNAVGWVDLSLLFASRGLPEKARRSMSVGLGIAPNNRFVLRSAARLFLHLGELDLAHDVLKRSSLARVDPWVCAAEIAVATAIKRSPRVVDFGVDMLRRKQFSDHDTSELSSALGMLDFVNGSARNARKHFRNSLLAPNENSLAQARWMAKDMGGLQFSLSTDDFQVARPFEASTWQAFIRHDWAQAVYHAESWAKDESFSTRPVQLAAHIYASHIEDFDRAIMLAKSGLIANPHEHGFRITAAFAYANSNRMLEAQEQLKEIKGPMSAEIEVARIANYGLIGFRQNDTERGRHFYSHALEVANIKENRTLTATVLANWAREEILAGENERGSVLLVKAKEADKSAFSLENPLLIAKVENLLLWGSSSATANVNKMPQPEKQLTATSNGDALDVVTLSWIKKPKIP
jgi:hypothetical protein